MPLQVSFNPRGWEEYQYWQATDKQKLKKINALINDICRHPFDGIGKPEPLRHRQSGYWSRRIDDEHRLVYEVAGDTVSIMQCRYHYQP